MVDGKSSGTPGTPGMERGRGVLEEGAGGPRPRAARDTALRAGRLPRDGCVNGRGGQDRPERGVELY